MLLLANAAAYEARAQEVTPACAYASSGEVRIRYCTFGEGPPLLLLNGGPGWSSAHMAPVAERLAQTHRVVLFDQRGTGMSYVATLDSTSITMAAMVADIEAVRQRLGIDRWAVMGHSFGGMLAMAYIARHAAHVHALVLSASAGASLAFLDYYPASMEYRLLPHEREAVAYWSDPARMAADPSKATYEVARASVGAFLYDRSRLQELQAALTEETWSIATSTLVWQDLIGRSFDVRSEMRAFNRPVLVLQGRQDALGDLHAYELAQLFPLASLHIIEESAHILWLDREDAYFSIIANFLNALE